MSPAASHPIPLWIATISHLHPNKGIAWQLQHRTLRVSGFSLGAADAASGGLGLVHINAALKRLKHATFDRGATSTLSVSSAYFFLCRFSDVFSSSLPHAAIHLQPPSHTVLNQRPGSNAAVLQFPIMPNGWRFSATQSFHYFSSSPNSRFPAFSNSPDSTLLGKQWSPIPTPPYSYSPLRILC